VEGGGRLFHWPDSTIITSRRARRRGTIRPMPIWSCPSLRVSFWSTTRRGRPPAPVQFKCNSKSRFNGWSGCSHPANESFRQQYRGGALIEKLQELVETMSQPFDDPIGAAMAAAGSAATITPQLVWDRPERTRARMKERTTRPRAEVPPSCRPPESYWRRLRQGISLDRFFLLPSRNK
jgi:hypothetical protein